VDTLTLSQALVPYANSYALEVIAQHVLNAKDLPQEGFHDAGIDSNITGKLFFNLVAKLESLLYTYPYLREISKRVVSGLPLCLTYNPDARYLLKELPLLSTLVPSNKSTQTTDAIKP
jgi:hypothetical protein